MTVFDITTCPDCGGMVMCNRPYDERGHDYVEIKCMDCPWELDDPDLESRDS